MKKLIQLLFIFCPFPAICFGQQVEAKYNVTRNINIPAANAIAKTIPVSYSGFLYRNNNSYIYFEKPNYLSKLSNGSLTVSQTNNNNVLISLNTDSLQSIYYTDYDSLIIRSRSEFNMERGKNYSMNFKPDKNNWTLLPDTKSINGLHCQKATFSSVGGQLQWVVWFSEAIPMQAGVSFTKGLPGLIVEAECIPLNIHYTLQEYTVSNEIPATIFWPEEFNEPFIDLKPAGTSNQRQREKSIKQQELEKQ